MAKGFGDTPNEHDILTGSQPDGRAYTDAADHTCSNWTSSGMGTAQLGHLDRMGGGNASWNSVHPSQGCSQQNLVATGGAGCCTASPLTNGRLKMRIALWCVVTAGFLSAQDGSTLYDRTCASCHNGGNDRAPSRDALRSMSADRVLAAMETGPMISMAVRLTTADRRAIAEFVSGKADRASRW